MILPEKKMQLYVQGGAAEPAAAVRDERRQRVPARGVPGVPDTPRGTGRDVQTGTQHIQVRWSPLYSGKIVIYL